MNILLVDDEEMILKVTADLLRVRGHHPRTARNGLEALMRMEEETPDLVLSDVRMPGMDGLAFLKASRAQFPETPVVLMTGDGDVDTAVAAFRGGAYDYLKKPVRVEDLLDCVKSIQEHRCLEA